MSVIIFISIFVLLIIIHNYKKTTTKVIKNNKSRTTTTLDEIPETFIEFPEYQGVLLEKPVLTTTKDYTRITMLYNDYIDKTYLENLSSVGFKKASDVRYDRNNTYIIVEEIDDTTKIAFHIKTAEIKTAEINTAKPINNNNPIIFS